MCNDGARNRHKVVIPVAMRAVLSIVLWMYLDRCHVNFEHKSQVALQGPPYRNNFRMNNRARQINSPFAATSGDDNRQSIVGGRIPHAIRTTHAR